MNRLIKGFTILLKYCPEGEHWDTSANHDIIYCGGPDPNDLSKEDAEELSELGFHYDEREKCWCKFT